MYTIYFCIYRIYKVINQAIVHYAPKHLYNEILTLKELKLDWAHISITQSFSLVRYVIHKGKNHQCKNMDINQEFKTCYFVWKMVHVIKQRIAEWSWKTYFSSFEASGNSLFFLRSVRAISATSSPLSFTIGSFPKIKKMQSLKHTVYTII